MIGIPDAEAGEVPKAFIVKKTGHQVTTVDIHKMVEGIGKCHLLKLETFAVETFAAKFWVMLDASWFLHTPVDKLGECWSTFCTLHLQSILRVTSGCEAEWSLLTRSPSLRAGRSCAVNWPRCTKAANCERGVTCRRCIQKKGILRLDGAILCKFVLWWRYMCDNPFAVN